ncbi:replication protein A1-like protein [Trifolium medium]|uniref:Replication protein A1-like protein n=1 Tax=Trifolium medium TaxID=97028 RepID=A0A392QSM9_9FABA|nr:replication protein A1-like protein [Trifolium medium]
MRDLRFVKTLTYYDITTGFLIIPYEEFGEKVLEKKDTTISVVDDCGNKWDCMLIYVSFPNKHFKIGGEWKRMVAARRIAVGDVIELFGRTDTKSESLYLILHH